MTTPQVTTTQTTSPSTALTVADRASQAVETATYETKLVALAATAKTITAISNEDGYKEAHATRMLLKNTRLKIAALSKAAREDATAFSKACAAEEGRLVAIIASEEDRLNELQKAWEVKVEAEKKRKLEEEAARIAAIKEKIASFQRFVLKAIGKTSAEIAADLATVRAIVIDESYGQPQKVAIDAQAEALAALTELLDKAQSLEAAQEQIRLERERQQRAEEDRRALAAKLGLEHLDDLDFTADNASADTPSPAPAAAVEAPHQPVTVAVAEVAVQEPAEIPVVAQEKPQQAKSVATQPEQPEQPDLSTTQSSATKAGPASTQARPSDAEILQVVADHFNVSVATARDWVFFIAAAVDTPAARRAA